MIRSSYKNAVFAGVRKAYAPLAAGETVFSRGVDLFSPEETQLLSRFIGKTDKILLLGGAGKHDIQRWEKFGAEKIVVLDLSLESLRLTSPSVSRAAGNAARLPIKKSSVDHIYWGSALYNHLPGRGLRKEGLRQAKQVLKNGVMIVMCHPLPHAPGLLGRISSLQPLRVLKQWLGGNFSAREPGDCRLQDGSFFHHFRSHAEIEKEFEAAGLKVIGRIGGMWVLH